MTWMITPEQTLAVARRSGLGEEELKLADLAVLTFSKAVVDRLGELCEMENATWLGPQHHPYAACEVVKRGFFEGTRVAALVPPMGASPLSSVLEDLATCEVKVVLLVCASWSLGPPVHFGDLVVPTFAAGPDGTSLHYGNTEQYLPADLGVASALAEACEARGVRVHAGGVGACEAIYRITPQMASGFRSRGCLCMENGEAATLFATTQARRVRGGVLFQPYLDLADGWDPARLRDESYSSACRLQAEVALEAGLKILHQGQLQVGKLRARKDIL